MKVITFLSLFVSTLGVGGYFLTAFIAMLESVIFVGFFIPGGTFLALAGFASAGGHISPIWLVVFGGIGSVLGDCISFYFGGHGVKFFKKDGRFFKLSHLEVGQKFFKKYGARSVFFGRFISPIRPAIAFVAGVAKMNFKSFMFWNTTSAFVWSGAYVCIGYFFGASLPLFEMWIKRVGIFSLVFVVAVIVIWLLILRSSMLAKGFSALYKKEALLPVAFAFLVLAVAFFELSSDFVFVQEFLTVDNIVHTFFAESRTPILVYIFYAITLFGGFWFASLLSLAVFLWSVSKKMYEYAWGIAMSVVGSGAVVLIGKFLISRARPEDIVSQAFESSFSFPSGHAGMAVALYGFLAYMLIDRRLGFARKWQVIVGATIFIILLGISRLFLGVHYLTDVLGGYMVGVLWLVGGILLSEHIKNKKKK